MRLRMSISTGQQPSGGSPAVSAAVSVILILLAAAGVAALTNTPAVAQETGETAAPTPEQTGEETGEESEMAPSTSLCPQNSAEVILTVPPKPWKKSDTIGVDPEKVEVFFPETTGKAAVVCWKAEGLEDGMTLHLHGKPGEEDLFPNAERTIRPVHPIGMSGKPAKLGTWRYELWITEEGSPDKFLETDPEVLVKSGGGGGGGGI